MENLKYFFFIALGLLFTESLEAQHHHIQVHKIEEFKDDLNLSDQQIFEIETIREKYRQEKKELHGQSDHDRHEVRGKMRELTSAQAEDIKKILTENQRAILDQKIEEKHREHFEKRKANRSNREALHKELKSYRSENVEPVLLTQREKLEEKIEEADKIRLEQLRPSFQQFHDKIEKRHEDLSESENPMRKEERKAWHKELEKLKEDMKPAFEEMHHLVEKYDHEINALMEELGEERQNWRKDMNEIRSKYKGESAGEKKLEGKKQHQNHHRELGDMSIQDAQHRKAHFLLMKPNVLNPGSVETKAVRSIALAPNPAMGSSKLTYETSKQSNLRIELKDEKGQTLKVLFDGNKHTGIHYLEVDLSQYKNGIYFISIQSGKEIVSERIILAK